MSWSPAIACRECAGAGEYDCECCGSGPLECECCQGSGLDPEQFDVQAWLAAVTDLGSSCGLYRDGVRVGSQTFAKADGRSARKLLVEEFRKARRSNTRRKSCPNRR